MAKAIRPRWRKRVSLGHPFFLVLPGFLVLFLLTIYPFIYMVWISLHKWPIIPTLPRPFLGLRQYGYIFADPEFWNSLQVTALYMFFSVASQLVLGVFLALLLHTPNRSFRFFRLAFMIPVFVSPVVVALIWRLMYGYDLGILNYLLGLVGIDGVNWLGHQVNALISIIIVDIWQWTPFTLLIALAALESLSSEPFEAAALDGANRLQTFWHITLPMMTPMLIVALLFRVLDAFKLFDIVYILTRGGPGSATNLLSYNIWRKGFFENQLGYAAALSVLMILIATVLAMVLIRILMHQRKGA